MKRLRINQPISCNQKNYLAKTSSAHAAQLKRRLRNNQKDAIRKKLPFNYPIYFMWYHFLRLSLELESLKHQIPERGPRGIELGERFVTVERDVYSGWRLEEIMKLSFHQWCNQAVRQQALKQLNYNGKPQYDSLAKWFNVYVRYFNGLEEIRTMGRTEFGYRLITQWEAVRYERVRRNTNKSLSDYGKVFWKDVKAAESVIQSVCVGQFP